MLFTVLEATTSLTGSNKSDRRDERERILIEIKGNCTLKGSGCNAFEVLCMKGMKDKKI